MLLLSAAMPARAVTLADSTAVVARAHEFTPYVSSNTPGPLWAAFDATMRAAMQDSTQFARTLDAIHATVGAIVRTTGEAVTQERGMWVYRATCEFEKVSDPALLLFAFTPDGAIAGLAVRPIPKEFASTRLDYVTKTTLQLPFHGEWFVLWGGRTLAQNYHAVSKSQRFACDFLIVKDGVSHTGDGSRLTDYYAYGQDVLAPADGQVVWACDSLPDQEPGLMDAKHPVGNGVVIDHGNGEFSVLAHMQPKSVRVKVGDRVAAGDVVGKCGNSGHTTEPHIHYHLQDGPDFTTAEGLPAAFVHICVNGKSVDKAEPVKGEVIKRCP